jgi:Cu/Ag efflux pump CusA
MRRWLWPYAILAAVLSLIGIGALLVVFLGSGADRAGAQLSVANAVAVEPMMRVLISMLEMVAPFDLPAWFKDIYAILALVALGGLVLSAAMGLLLLPVFYALYRGERHEAD